MHVVRIISTVALASGALAVPIAANAADAPAGPAPGPAQTGSGPVELFVDFPSAIAPQVGVDGTLPFLSWPAAQNPNGYEGNGYRIYLDRAYAGPGTYTMTLQKVGAGFSDEYPQGTVLVDENGVRRHPSNGNDKRIVTVLPALPGEPTAVEPEEGAPTVGGTSTPSDPSAPGAAAAPSDTVLSEVLAAPTNLVPLARTGYDETSSPVLAYWAVGAGAALAAATLVATRRRAHG